MNDLLGSLDISLAYGLNKENYDTCIAYSNRKIT